MRCLEMNEIQSLIILPVFFCAENLMLTLQQDSVSVNDSSPLDGHEAAEEQRPEEGAYDAAGKASARIRRK